MVPTNLVWPKGKASLAFTRKVSDHLCPILEGRMLAVDPSSKSLGWALYVAGELQNSGTIQTTAPSISERLQEMYDQLYGMEIPDILVIEEIKGAASHDYLKYSVGVSLAAIRTPICIPVPIAAWKMVSKQVPDYYKSDENDAKVIGHTVILMAREINANS